jgi:hypothetical protein
MKERRGERETNWNAVSSSGPPMDCPRFPLDRILKKGHYIYYIKILLCSCHRQHYTPNSRHSSPVKRHWRLPVSYFSLCCPLKSNRQVSVRVPSNLRSTNWLPQINKGILIYSCLKLLRTRFFDGYDCYSWQEMTMRTVYAFTGFCRYRMLMY